VTPRKTTRLEIVWYVGAVGIVLLFCGFAYRAHFDFVETIGFMWYNLATFFYLFLGLAFLLLGVDYISKLASGRIQLGKIDEDIRAYRKFALVVMAIEVLVIALIWWHPFGYIVSISLAGVVVIICCVFGGRLTKRFREPNVEQKITELPDKMLKATDEPNEPARWVP
jgi:hypothetical protein